MLELFRIPLLSVLSVYIVLLVGILCRRNSWITPDATDIVVKLVVNLFMPCLIASKIIGNDAFDDLANLCWPPLTGVGVVVLGLGVAWLYGRFLPRRWTGIDNRVQLGTFALCVGMLNYGYVPIPLIADLYPGDDKALSVLFVQNMGTEFALWTLGIFCLSGVLTKKSLLRMCNFPTIAILSCILIDVTGLSDHVPSLLMKSVDMIGVAAIPVSLLFVGAVIGDCTMRHQEPEVSEEKEMSLKQLEPDDKTHSWSQGGQERVRLIPLAVSSCLLRLVVLPALIILAARYLPVTRELKIVLVIHAAMASAVFPVVLSRLYGGSVKTSLSVILSNTVVAIFTTPLWIAYGLAFVVNDSL
ncbi:MAG: AEC family transporter [Planctomycetia bacterium]|nr:AEC family transporter [Planctomycetia bacterium]